MRAWILLAALSACLRNPSYKCTASAQCGASGACELAVGYCSFPDSTCGRRFDDSAGDLSNTCVGAGPIDAGLVDGPIDASMDAGTTCPVDYVTVAGYANHRYKLLAAQSWDAAKGACAGATTFFADPTEAAAVTALDTLFTSGTYWIGVSESAGSFQTVANTVQTFLPWAAGQPNTTGNSHCVQIAATGPMAGRFALSRCSDPHPAICECDP